MQRLQDSDGETYFWSGSRKPLSEPLPSPLLQGEGSGIYFLFGEALNSPPSCKKSEATSGFPVPKKRSILWLPPFEGGREGDLKGDGRGI